MQKPRLTISLRHSLILLWLLPVLFVCFSLGFYIIKQRISDIELALIEKQTSVLNYLSESSDFAMYANNTELLQKIADSVELGKDITGIVFFNAITGQLVNSGSVDISYETLKEITREPPSKHIKIKDTTLIYKKIISAAIDAEEDYFDTEAPLSEEQILGYVFLLTSEEYLNIKQTQILITGVLTSLLGLILAILFAYFFNKRISNIITTTSDSISELKNGNFDKRIKGNYSGETKELFDGINSLAHRLDDHNKEMNYNIQIATERLRKQNIELKSTREKAINANKSKDQFLAKMSHELRTPVNAISGFAKLIRDNSNQKEHKENSDIIISSSNILLSIIDELLEFSKIELGKTELIINDFDLSQCLEKVIAINSGLAKEKNIELCLEIEKNIEPNIKGDEYKLIQILNNLVTNAIKYTIEGNVSVKTKLAEQIRGMQLFEFIVTDTGIGINKKDLDHIFEPFHQLNTDINIKNEGTGLGLSIVHRLTALMNGDITINSEPGNGTEIIVKIPFEKSFSNTDRNEEEIKNETELLPILIDESNTYNNADFNFDLIKINNINNLDKAIQNNVPSIIIVHINNKNNNIYYLHQLIQKMEKQIIGLLIFLMDEKIHFPFDNISKYFNTKFLYAPFNHPELNHYLNEFKNTLTTDSNTNSFNDTKILIAEDHDFNRLLLIKTLNQQGCATYEAKNGQELLELLADINPDLILCDLHMPEINGVQVCEKIRSRSDQLKDTPIIIMTADVISLNDENLYKTGANDIIYKPINIDHLLEKISQYSKATKIIPIKHHNRQTWSSISSEELFSEYSVLITRAIHSLKENDLNSMKKTLHKLKGVTGLSNHLLLIYAVNNFTSEKDVKQLWHSINRIQRIIDKECAQLALKSGVGLKNISS